MKRRNEHYSLLKLSATADAGLVSRFRPGRTLLPPTATRTSLADTSRDIGANKRRPRLLKLSSHLNGSISNIPAKSSSSVEPNDFKNHAIGYLVSYLKPLVFISISITDSDAAAADGRDGSFCLQQTEEDRSSDAMRWREK
jgi:hypothetical protein